MASGSGKGSKDWIAWGVGALAIFGLIRACDPTPLAPTGGPPPDAVVQLPAGSLSEVSAADIALAARHARIALDAEGLEGAQIYSVNCYAALERAFDLAKLDQCGAFDALISPAATDDVSPSLFFDQEAAQERFEQAARSGGVQPSDMTLRLLEVQRLANAEGLPAARRPPARQPVERAASTPEAIDEASVEEEIKPSLPADQNEATPLDVED